MQGLVELAVSGSVVSPQELLALASDFLSDAP
jgi:hypothetical protein